MATRRIFNSMLPTFWLSAGDSPLRCSTSGMTIWFDTMIASATHSTITMAVAADRPPMNTATVNSGEPPACGSASTNMSVSSGAHRKHDQACERDRDDEQVDGDQVQREQPPRPADFQLTGVFHHADVELPRQQHDGEEREQRHDGEIAP